MWILDRGRMVRGGGHGVPQHRPQAMLAILRVLFADEPLARPPPRGWM